MITIKRITAKRDGVFGVLLGEDGLPYFVTLEPTLDDTFKPVIPAGVYVASPTWYNTGKYRTFEVNGVAGHSRLLFHIGNNEEDSRGCILVGTSFGTLGGKRAILGSTKAFNEFMALMPDVGFDVRFE